MELEAAEEHRSIPVVSALSSSLSVRLKVWITLPSIWFLIPSGLMICPQSCARRDAQHQVGVELGVEPTTYTGQ
jgi:hypothetical protein